MAAGERIALLKDNAILLLASDGQVASKLEGDSRPKTVLRWLPDGQRLSYLVPDNSGAKARLVVMGLTGTVLKEVAIRPVTDPPTEGLRFIEELSWVTARKVRVAGSINPENCEMFDLDVETAQESNWQTGECGSFTASPDGKHIAYLDAMETDDERRDSVGIDNDKVIYSDGGRMAVLAGPAWSPDSSQVAILEKRADSGEFAVTTVSTGGHTDTIPIPKYLGDHPSLVFVDSRVVVRSATESVLVDPRNKSAGAVPDDMRSKLEQTDRARQGAADSEKDLERVIQRLGAREGVAWPGVTKH